MRSLVVAVVFAVLALHATGQQMVLDKVIAKVGNEFVLHSEVEERYALAKERGAVLPDNMKCTIVEELMVTNLLVHHARIDSVEVEDAEVERQLDERITQILQMMGDDVQQFESYYGMTVAQAKELNRIDLRKKLNAEKVRRLILENIKVTPAEVIEYFNQIPEDSLPYFNSEVEIGEIIYKPEVNPVERQKALDRVKEIQNRIKEGEPFADLAMRYSDDFASGRQGGDLGRTTRGSFVPEYEAAAYKTDVGDVTGIVETQFGFHIIKVEGRWGNAIQTRHILIRPHITEADLDSAKQFLLDLREGIMSDSMAWAQAVSDYSDEDSQSYSNSGRVSNPKTGNTFFETPDLDHQVFFAIDSVEVGGLTGPVEFRSQTGDVYYKLIQLQSRTPPHRASLQRDYSKILNAAKQSKQNEAFGRWIDRKIGQTFIVLEEDYYAKCPNLEKWNTGSVTKS